MRSWLKYKLASQAWPDPDTDMLIKSTLLPPDRAQEYWRKWKSQNDIDECTWPQFKILARFSGRLPEIDRECPEIPRLHGMAKALWTNSQLQLNRAAVTLDLLTEAEIPVYLMKTAALEALNMTKLTRRVTSDIDLIVKRKDLRRTLEILFEHGWNGPKNVDDAVERCRYHPGVNLKKGLPEEKTDSDVDVHHQPVHMPFMSDSLMEQFWKRAVPGKFRGRSVFLPAPEELLVITAMQGIRRFVPSHKSSGLWAFDIVEILSTQQLNWDTVLQVAEQSNGSWALLSCLSYLQNELDFEIDQSVLDRLAKQVSANMEAMMFYAQSPTYGVSKALNLPLREVVLLRLHKRFCREGYLASQNW